MSIFYMLECNCSDTPYYDKINRWFATSIEELKTYYDEQWMDNITIYIGKWNTPLIFKCKSFERQIHQPSAQLYQSILPVNISQCIHCNIFYNTDKKYCNTCNIKCKRGYKNIHTQII